MPAFPYRLGAPANPLARLIPWKISQRRLIKDLDWVPKPWEVYVPNEDRVASQRERVVRDEALRQCDGDDGVS
jgi:hypothetical protein